MLKLHASARCGIVRCPTAYNTQMAGASGCQCIGVGWRCVKLEEHLVFTAECLLLHYRAWRRWCGACAATSASSGSCWGRRLATGAGSSRGSLAAQSAPLPTCCPAFRASATPRSDAALGGMYGSHSECRPGWQPVLDVALRGSSAFVPAASGCGSQTLPWTYVSDGDSCHSSWRAHCS